MGDEPSESGRIANAPLGLNGILQSLVGGSDAPERVSLSQIAATLDERARAVLIVLFAIPNCLPGIPGTSAITGLPLLFLTVQMALSRPPWLPGFLSERTVSTGWLRSVLGRAEPWIVRIERLIRPRLSVLCEGPAERAIGLVCAVLALTVMLPIPLGNILPSLALIAFSLALIGRDGCWVLVGLAITAASATLLTLAGWAAFQSLLYLWVKWFGLA